MVLFQDLVVRQIIKIEKNDSLVWKEAVYIYHLFLRQFVNAGLSYKAFDNQDLVMEESASFINYYKVLEENDLEELEMILELSTGMGLPRKDYSRKQIPVALDFVRYSGCLTQREHELLSTLSRQFIERQKHEQILAEGKDLYLITRGAEFETTNLIIGLLKEAYQYWEHKSILKPDLILWIDLSAMLTGIILIIQSAVRSGNYMIKQSTLNLSILFHCLNGSITSNPRAFSKQEL